MEGFYQMTYFKLFACIFIVGGISYTVGLYEYRKELCQTQSFFNKYKYLIGTFIIEAIYYIFPDVIVLAENNNPDFTFLCRVVAFVMNIMPLLGVYLLVAGAILCLRNN